MSEVHNDLPLMEIAKKMATLVKESNADVYLKWTCPKCGDRVTADEPNTIYTQGMKHEECGWVYTGDLYGMMVVFKSERSTE